MQFFFYGTLLDPEVRAAVMPHIAESLELQPARLRGYRRVRARHGTYPVLVSDARSRVDGLLVSGLDARALYRMAHFEGDLYLPQQRRVRATDGAAAQAWIFMAVHPGLAAQRSWSLQRWRMQHKRRLLADTSRWMREFGVDNGQAHDMNWPFRRTIQALAADLEMPEDALSWQEAA